MQVQFRTMNVPPADRVDYWRSAMLDSLNACCSVEPAGRRGFDASMTVLRCGSADVVRLEGSPFRIRRLGPGRRDWVSLMFQCDGFATLEDGCHVARLGPGDACIVPPDREIFVDRKTPFRQLLLNVREDELDRTLPDWRRHTCDRMEAHRPGLQASRDLLLFLAARADLLDLPARAMLTDTALSLVGQDAPARGRSAQARLPGSDRMALHHRQRAERYIAEHLHDPELSVPCIAAGLGVSVRYLHRLFEGGAPVMQWVLEQRLQACEREISAQPASPVSSVAYAWGFTSAAHFSRAYKKRFGHSPSQR